MPTKSFAITVLCVLSLASTAHSQFYQPKTYGIGGDFITEADINNDGLPDVIGLAYDSKTQQYSISVALGNGKGGFSTPKTTAVTGLKQPGAIAVGNFTGSGFSDVAITGSDPVTGVAAIGVMLGNGDGTFQATQIYDSSVPGNFNTIVTGSFLGGSTMDVAAQVNGDGGAIAVFPGKGNGKFGKPTTTIPDTYAFCLAAADFNNDGKLDLTNGTAIFLGNGKGGFDSPITVPDGGCDVAVADLNADGNLDLVTGASNPPFTEGNSLRVHLGNGTGKFGAGTAYTTGLVAGLHIKIASFSGSAPDIAASNAYDQDISVLLNKGDGTFKAGKNWNTGNSAGFVVGDFNQDGKLDMVYNNTYGLLTLVAGNGNGTFQDEFAENDLSAPPLPGGSYISADVNNDQKLDLVFADGVALGNGDGTFQPVIFFPANCIADTVGDFNGDGNLDVAGPGPNGDGVAVCMGNGKGTFAGPAVYDQGIPHQFVLAGAFTDSGNIDLAASDSGGISILLGKGNGKFEDGIPTGVNASFPTFVLGDFNNDGKLDLAAITEDSTVSVLLGKGNGKFSPPVENSIAATQLYAGDMNNDGKLDLVVVNNIKATLGIWLGQGNGQFTNSASVASEGFGTAVLADFNQDGNLDVAVSASPHFMVLLEGNGKGGFQKQINYLGGNAPSGVFAGSFSSGKFPDVIQEDSPYVNHIRLDTFLNVGK
ncbi:MAG TPA: VCBS repeat-containing protein [Terriglobales bacterium]